MGLTTTTVVAGSITAAPMPAHHDPLHDRVLSDPVLLGEISAAIGGPFHLMYPDRLAENIRGFRSAFEQARVSGAVYYAKKANKAGCVIRACAESDAGAEVSTVGEFTAAMAGGIRGTDLMITGPAKSDELLWLSLRHGALISIDSLGELDRLLALSGPTAAGWVLLRVRPPGSQSRFGLTEGELAEALHRIDPNGPISVEGFSFHLSGYDPAPRATLAAALVDRCLAARQLGHDARTISIGGGFSVDYVAAEDWTKYTERVDRKWFHAGHLIEEYYPYHCARPGAAMLTDVLATAGLAGRLRSADIRLVVEPGRALLDRAGCTVFRVQATKTRAEQKDAFTVAAVDGSSLSLSEQWFASEYLPDPVLWPSGVPASEPTPTCVGAATCLESDMLSWRRVPLPREPQIGDLLVYPNTAGYQMDSNESAFQEMPIPPKVVLHEYAGRLGWTLDR